MGLEGAKKTLYSFLVEVEGDQNPLLVTFIFNNIDSNKLFKCLIKGGIKLTFDY